MIIGVTGGKGGTGKSTIATSLAYQLSQNNKVLLVDADVECPNDNLILKSRFLRETEVTTFMPKFNMNKCTHCGLCSKNCKEHAIVVTKDKLLFFPEQCTGCKVCMFVCPEKAISPGRQGVGFIKDFSVSKNLIIKAGFLNPSVEESAVVVKELIKEVELEKDNYNFIIIDTAAGTHCDVIKALIPTEEIILVTEPTPLGLNDLKLITEVVKKLNKKNISIIINKLGISREYEEKIEAFAEDNNIKIMTRIRYNEEMIKDYIQGTPITNNEIKRVSEEYEKRTI